MTEGGTHGQQVETLWRYVNQIAKNFVAIGHDRAVLATADHIESFWDPRMKAAIFASDRSGLDPIAAEAIAHLEHKGDPGSQTRATEFSTHGGLHNSDAG
ncbi:formate dehydrogenase subunit delta [Paraurantiacibacter namhicola]|uniref:NADH-dependent formate dehydrogenase delta subunit FdsD n=1 Tax=Paraurantiacibacter namhicola TaxID=645517 RepID=A0A1C7D4M6_9SPHN|nr:formate dehydrogenase subunit delta [Paraurantiacibacter namhicola]ANU06426.1 NADH-dependent formate dehydrogenase delta subunit FdsD [Paraurantiacibacter namhicola]